MSAEHPKQAPEVPPSHLSLSLAPRRLPARLAYPVAVVSNMVMLAVYLGVSARGYAEPIGLFLLPIILSAYLGGLGPGLLSTAMSALLTTNLLVHPPYAIVLTARLDTMRWIVLIMAGILGSILSEALHRAHESAQRISADLQRSERTLKLFVERTPAAIAMFDTQMRYLAVSRRFIIDYRLEDQDVIGRSHYEIFPELSDPVREVHRRCLAGAIEKCDEDPFPRADGTVDWVRWEMHPWYEDATQIGGVVLFSEVITPRKQAEAAAEKSNRRFHQTLDTMLEGCQIIGFDWRYRYLNDSALRHARRPREELIGQTMMASFPGIEQTELFRLLQRCMKERISQRVENEFSYPHDESAWFDLSVQPSPEGLFILSIDITDRKHAEANLQAERAQLAERVAERTADLRLANAELARATRLKDEFLANMSHELRTPLTAILGRTELLQELIYGPITPRQDEALRSIEASGQHLLSLINDILDLSKIEAGKIEIEQRPVWVASLCRASLQMVAQTAQAKRITIHTAYDSQVEIIHGDERRLKQILVNLLTNAVKFTPANGSIGLEVDGDIQARTVSVTVWDTGIGIAADQMGQLFQPFMQIDHGLSRQYEGTGLGLALVQRLTTAHGGSVDVKSALGQGSRFRITLPWIVDLLSVPPQPDQAPGDDPDAAAPVRLRP